MDGSNSCPILRCVSNQQRGFQQGCVRTHLRISEAPESFCSYRAYLYQWYIRGSESNSWPGLACICDKGLSARGKEVVAPDETPFSTDIGGPEPVLPGWLWRILSDDNQHFHNHSHPDDSPTRNLNAIADAHNGSRSVSSEFSPALSVD